MSTPASPLSPLVIGNHRRLSSRRRGSMAAPDPFGTFQDSERGMSSTLHIIKAPSVSPNQDTEEAARRRTSIGSNARYHTRSHSGPGSDRGRISFAFSGFSPMSPQKEDHSGSRSLSAERPQPASPSSAKSAPRSHSFTALPTVQTPLTPMQVYDLAQQCNNPSTPGGDASIPPTPVSFTPLPDGHYLPFLDRPSEVQALLSTPPTSRLFSLLAQAFPSKTPPGPDDKPALWSYAQLEHWLFQVGRDEADDTEWVRKAGACISAKSELIWERVKGALGVPPDLDGFHEGIDEPDTELSPGQEYLDGEDGIESFGGAWVEPIMSTSPVNSPLPPARSPTTPYRRSLSANRRSAHRMEDISEDAPEPDPAPSPAPPVHGLRLVTPPSEPPARRFSSPSPSSAGSFSHPHVPYNVVAERGPGHPLFPSSFARLALGPTLSANNPSLRSPVAPPASAYPLPHSTTHHRRRAPSWAEGWDPEKQEYAVSAASGSSRRSLVIE